MRYKIGDKVMIKKDLHEGHDYEVFATEEMEAYAGQVVTIDYVDADNKVYEIKEDDEWYWTEDMFEDNSKTIKFAKLRQDVIIPSKRLEDGAFDIYANFEQDYMVINPHQTVMIPTGLCSAFPSDYVAILKERGSTGTKGMGQRCGVVDSGYRGEWFIPITNHNDIPLIIAKKEKTQEFRIFNGDLTDGVANIMVKDCKDYIIYPYEKAIAQCIMVEVPKLTIEECTVDEIKSISSERGEGMLGSSNK